MNARTRLQLRLQTTVEGLSVAAITYYVVGLFGYLVKARPRQRPDDDRTEYRDRGLRADRRSCDLVDGAADPEKENRRRGLTLVTLRLCRGWMLRDTQRRVAGSITSLRGTATATGRSHWSTL